MNYCCRERRYFVGQCPGQLDHVDNLAAHMDLEQLESKAHCYAAGRVSEGLAVVGAVEVVEVACSWNS